MRRKAGIIQIIKEIINGIRKQTVDLLFPRRCPLCDDVLPVFEILNSRESIIAHRREYPWFDTLNSRLILLEESMIYGHMGDKKKAKECFEMYYRSVALKLSEGAHIKRHLEYLDELRSELEW